MTLQNHSRIEASVSSAPRDAVPLPARSSVRACDFRSAIHLSTVSAQHLTTLHESFARMASSELDFHLAASMQIKLVSLEQLGARDYIAGASSSGYVLPCTIGPAHGKMLVELDSELLFPILDLLLGGNGQPAASTRELTELDEELLKSVTTVILKRLELAWKLDNVSLVPERSIKPALAIQVLPADGKVVLLMFEVSVADSTGSLNLVLPHSFANFLVRNSQVFSPRKRALDPELARRALREKVLTCNFTVSTELPNLSIPVHELINLKAGSLLELRVPVSTPVKLIIEHHELFQVTPVRNGNRKAAQLGASMPSQERDQDYPQRRMKQEPALLHPGC